MDSTSRFERRAPGALRGERALLHPLWLVALALLAFNDHVLKVAAHRPAVSGKLSDFAGLVVAPVVLIALARVGTRRAALWCHVAIGLVFAAIQLSPAAAGLWDSGMSLVGVNWHTWSDPTDLMALPVLVLSWRVLVPVMQRPTTANAWMRPVRLAAGSVALLCCIATSDVVEPLPANQACRDDVGNSGPCDVDLCWDSNGSAVYCQFSDCPAGEDGVPDCSLLFTVEERCVNAGGEFVGGECQTVCEGMRNSADDCVFRHDNISLFVYNDTQDPALMRVLRLRPDIEIDCLAARANPSQLLKRPLFEPAGSWTIGAHQARPLANHDPSGRRCDAVLLDSDRHRAQVVIFDATIGTTVFDDPTLDALPINGVVLRSSNDGDALESLDASVIVSRSTSIPRLDAYAEQCRPMPDHARVEWTTWLANGQTVLLESIENGTDGCLRLATSTDGRTSAGFLCVPDEVFPFDAGDVLRVSHRPDGFGLGLSQLVEVSDDSGSRLVATGLELALLRSSRRDVVAPFGFSVAVTPVESCAPVPDVECGTVFQQANATIVVDTTRETLEMSAGDWGEFNLADGRLQEIHLARIGQRPVVATACSGGADQAGADVELVLLRYPAEEAPDDRD